MKNYELGVVESRFADIIWQQEPLSSGELVRMCNELLNWKKSTTYTVLRKLCDKGLFCNIEGVVTSRISREDYYISKSKQFICEYFKGSLPNFLVAFSKSKSLSAKEVREIQQLIDAYQGRSL